MLFCHNFISFVLKVVSTKRSIAIGEEETCKVAIRGQEKKGEFEGKVYQK
jgi:hypothetical protein